jgi:hypothetical protein
MITYIEPDPIRLPGWRVPKLHGGKISKSQPTQADDLEILTWCTENCAGKFYSLPSWSGIGAQFEEEDDWISFSMWARLRWS